MEIWAECVPDLMVVGGGGRTAGRFEEVFSQVLCFEGDRLGGFLFEDL
jgi:hypothetical protein